MSKYRFKMRVAVDGSVFVDAENENEANMKAGIRGNISNMFRPVVSEVRCEGWEKIVLEVKADAEA